MSGPAPRGYNLDDWLAWQSASPAGEIELGLKRVARVARAMNLLPLAARVVTIAGTNGKGSCAALIAELATGLGRVGSYTSPHLWRYNERIRIDGACVDDVSLCRAFVAVEAARGAVSLTYFEYGTLAALWLFAKAQVDVAVLEVGLGGRLDAVNIADADVALITNIGLDHMDWLGPDRECIGFEKAGILRAGRPAFCADRAIPRSVAAQAASAGASLAVVGQDFDINGDDRGWRWRYADCDLSLPAQPGILADNLAAALCVARALGLPVQSGDAVRACAAAAKLVGRRERVDGAVPIIYDVGHNTEAVAVLVDDLRRESIAGCTRVVLAMLADKPVERVGATLREVADVFYPAGLDRVSSRGLTASLLADRLGHDGARYADPAAALAAARRASRPGDRIVVCGSFYTVAQARRPNG